MRLFVLFIIFPLSYLAQGQGQEDAVKNIISSAYIGGIHNNGSVEDIRSGFHPSFQMLRMIDNQISPLPIEEWIGNLEKNRASQQAPSQKTEGRFIRVDVVGNSANVVLELYRSDKKIFTDHLLLYQSSEGWRIVSKTYFRHPQQ